MIRNLLKAALVLFLGVTWIVTSPFLAAAGEKELYAAAKKEGKIHWGGTMASHVGSEVNKLFMKKYPGIQIKYTRKGTAGTVQTIEAELMAKKITYDIVNITDPQTLSRWKKQKVLVPYPNTFPMEETKGSGPIQAKRLGFSSRRSERSGWFFHIHRIHRSTLCLQ
jgi:spermidine/putrescine-binding protein